jgi:hypothetical protein
MPTPRKLDQNFDMPPNVVDLEWKSVEENTDSSDFGDVGEGAVTIVDIEEADNFVDPDPSSGNPLYPPDNVTVIEYIPKMGLDGTVLVDVVLEVDGASGTSNYEVKIKKL